MWAMAASAAVENTMPYADRLYRCALQIMQEVDALYIDRATRTDATRTDGSNELEQVQALILLSLYELKYVGFRRGWIIAGRAFSLIQLNLIRDMPSWVDD